MLLWSIHGHLQKLAANYRAQTITSLSNVRVEVDLAALVRSTCDAFRFQLGSDIDLIVRLNPIATVLGADVQLGNALENLLVNARNAISELGRRGTIRVTTSQDGDTVQVEVADDGPGFPTNLPVGAWLERGTTGRLGGSGLGLHSVRETAERHGGTVHVSSVEGRGATITMKLPRAQTRPTQGPRRVLLIDDDASVLRAATRALGKIHKLETCMDGQAALEVLQRDSSFDAILCDLEMPRLDGPGLYRALQANHPEVIPRLAFCSGGASTQEMRDFLREVNPPMLPKPFEAQAVIALVEALATRPAG
jgi:two-component system NtrC family sensor kinase